MQLLFLAQQTHRPVCADGGQEEEVASVLLGEENEVL